MKKIFLLFITMHLCILTKAQSNEVMFHFGDGFGKDTVSFLIDDVLIFHNQLFESTKNLILQPLFVFKEKILYVLNLPQNIKASNLPLNVFYLTINLHSHLFIMGVKTNKQ
jgi:hypothetical protein